MWRVFAIVVVAMLGACGGDGVDDEVDDGIVDRDREVPADVRAFLDRVVDTDELAFTATYAVLNKNGGGEHVVEVVSTPPALQLEIDGRAVDADDDSALFRYGIFSGFLSANPKAAIEAAARRADAGDAVFSERTAAGITLDCIAIPIQEATPTTACLTVDGIFGSVDNPAVRYELTAYEANA